MTDLVEHRYADASMIIDKVAIVVGWLQATIVQDPPYVSFEIGLTWPGRRLDF